MQRAITPVKSGFYILLSLAFFCSSAYAQEPAIPDEQQPINIQANQLNASEKQGKSIYQGDVIVTQGSLTLSGDRIEVFHPQGTLNKAITTGKPAHFKRFNTTEQSWIYGKANQIEYDTQAKTVLLIGDAEVEQPGKHLIKGPKLFYDIEQQTLQAESTPEEKKRISVTFTPTQAPAKNNNSK